MQHVQRITEVNEIVEYVLEKHEIFCPVAIQAICRPFFCRQRPVAGSFRMGWKLTRFDAIIFVPTSQKNFKTYHKYCNDGCFAKDINYLSRDPGYID